MDYVRGERRPFLLEVMVSRLYGHSSASGANFVPEEVDCLAPFEKKLEERRILSRTEMDELRAKYTQQLLEASKKVREEPQPKGEEIHRHVYAERGETGDPRGLQASKNGVH
jgi:2-oxoisovalerate dehydrogenase E1 component alpha subunit